MGLDDDDDADVDDDESDWDDGVLCVGGSCMSRTHALVLTSYMRR